MYGKVSCLIVKKTNRLTQAVVFFLIRRHFLCGAELCNYSSAEREVYLYMHNENLEQNPLCVESGVTNGFSISPRLSPTMFDPDANSVLLRAHHCTAVDVMCRKTCVRNCSRERKGLYNGNVLLTHLYTAAALRVPYTQYGLLSVFACL